MKWSWKLGKFAGIDVYMHATFLLLLAFVGYSYYLREASLASVLGGIAFILALFGCVVLHEYGHALTARRYGIVTRDITLYPMGGVARLERMPDDPRQELNVALMGPAVNVVIAMVLFGVLVLMGGFTSFGALSLNSGSFLERLMLVNVSLVLFNLLPAFPMDGGRVVRSLLAMRMEYTRATQIAATIGQGMAVLFGLVGLFTNPFLVFIAFFVWIGAEQEASMTRMKSSLGGIPVSRAMVTEFRSVEAHQPLSDVVGLILSGSQHDFPVLRMDRVVGILTRQDLMKALAQRGEDAPVNSIMRTDFQTADSYEMLEKAFIRLQACQCHTMPILHGGQLVGLLTMENVGEFLAIQAALNPRQVRV
jgi:Zn-dependent protease/CBS domain-containing protein